MRGPCESGWASPPRPSRGGAAALAGSVTILVMIRSGDRLHLGEQASHRLWGACAAFVLAFIFFAALGAFEPGEVLPLTVAALVLATLWLAHEWRSLWREERGR